MLIKKEWMLVMFWSVTLEIYGSFPVNFSKSISSPCFLSIPFENIKIQRLSDVFRGYRKGALVWGGLISLLLSKVTLEAYIKYTKFLIVRSLCLFASSISQSTATAKRIRLIKAKVTPTHVFSSEYCEIFVNTYFEEHLRTAAVKGENELHTSFWSSKAWKNVSSNTRNECKWTVCTHLPLDSVNVLPLSFSSSLMKRY